MSEMEVVVCPGFVVADNPPGVVPGSVKRVRLPWTAAATAAVRATHQQDKASTFRRSRPCC